MRVLVLAVLLVGCGARIAPDGGDRAESAKGPTADTGSAGWASPAADAAGSIDATEPPPADASDPVDPPPPPPVGSIDCFTDDVGPSSPDKLVELFWEQVTGTCPSSDCSDFVTFTASCAIHLQVRGVGYDSKLSPGDCTLFKKWLTSELLLTKLRDTVTCYGKDAPGPFESTSIELTDGFARKKTFTCPVEPFVSHRACIAKVRAKYFPGK
ncbi:MAG: hypothetical protein HYV09_32225 [Deltaproteobacteria bacterium]|nr:hypothetical protein [Deltaproteobacteria bacterium]